MWSWVSVSVNCVCSLFFVSGCWYGCVFEAGSAVCPHQCVALVFPGCFLYRITYLYLDEDLDLDMEICMCCLYLDLVVEPDVEIGLDLILWPLMLFVLLALFVVILWLVLAMLPLLVGILMPRSCCFSILFLFTFHVDVLWFVMLF